MTSGQLGSEGFVLKGQLHRVRRGKTVRFEAAPVFRPTNVRRPAKIARQLALAHHVQKAIEQGIAHDRAEVARRLGLTRARVTQLLDLLLLAPDLQASVLELQAFDGLQPATERGLRSIASEPHWSDQRKRFENLVPSCQRR